jgi:hypothetical protein
LIGISSIYQCIEGQGPPAGKQKQPQQQAKVKDIVGVATNSIDIYASSDGKACIAKVQLSSTRPNSLGLALGSTIDLLAPDENICTLLSLSRISDRGVFLDVEKLTTLNALPSTLRATGEYPIAQLYLVHKAVYSPEEQQDRLLAPIKPRLKVKRLDF